MGRALRTSTTTRGDDRVCLDRPSSALTRPSTSMVLCKMVLLLSALGLAHAHFVLNYPPTLGFDDTQETTAPCGGFPILINNLTSPSTNLTVGAFPIAVQSTHPSANWLFRATLSRAPPFNWTDLLPVVAEEGVGGFSVPDLSVPDAWVGNVGVVQIAQENAGEVAYQV
jgi:hypothetical protein